MRKVLILAACAFLLCCCTDSGEDSVSSRRVDSDAVALNDSIKVYVEDPKVWGVDEYSGRVAVVDSADQLPNCNAKTAGDTVLVNSIKKVYYCDSDNWEYFGKVTTDSWKFPFTKKSSSSAVRNTEMAYQELEVATSSSDSSASRKTSSSSFLNLSSSVFQNAPSSALQNSSSSAATPSESNLVEENRCKSTSNYSGFYWSGFDGIDVIFTGIDNGTESSGYWFDIGDSVYGGMSKIEWPEERGNAYSKDSFEPVIYACNGICGTYKLSKGAYTGVPYVGIAFNVVGVDPEYADDIYAYAPAQAADVTEWYGLCLTYSTDSDSTFLELSMGDTMDAKAGYRLPRLHLPKSADAKNICAPWGSFRVPAVSKTLFFDNDDESLIFTGPEVAAELATIRFIIRGEDGETGEFNLVDIGGYCW